MSEFPKSFQFVDSVDDVITFRDEHDVQTCKSGIRWSYCWVSQSTRWKPTDEHDELTALRTFHATVMQATQTESNARLPHAIFAADAEVRRATASETN